MPELVGSTSAVIEPSRMGARVLGWREGRPERSGLCL